jgi:hypothetical protein
MRDRRRGKNHLEVWAVDAFPSDQISGVRTGGGLSDALEGRANPRLQYREDLSSGKD